jgi:hypothetical protein
VVWLLAESLHGIRAVCLVAPSQGGWVIWIVGEISPLHSSALKKANRRRKLVQRPDFVNVKKRVAMGVAI